MKKLFTLSLIGIFLLMFLASGVNAFEFDNVKSYDSIKKEVTITNAFGLGKDLFKAQLISEENFPVVRGKDRLIGAFQIQYFNSEDYTLKEIIKNVELLDLKKLTKKKTPFTLKYLETEEKIINYKECLNYECSKHNLKTRTNIKKNWLPVLDEKDLFTNVTLGIFTNVYPNENGDWIPEFYGVKVPEWATWNETFESSLVSVYNFEESSGDLLDVWNNDDNGTLSGTPTRQQTGINNFAYDFDGTDDKADINSDTDFANPQSLTLSAWVNFDITTGSPRIFEKGVYGNHFGYYEMQGYTTNNKILCQRADESGEIQYSYSSVNSISTTGWYHIACVFTADGNSVNTYINGALDNDGTFGFGGGYTYSTNTEDLSIGGTNAGGGYLNGKIDEVYIWNEEKDTSFIQSLYDSGAGTFYNPNENPEVSLINPINNSKYTSTPQTIEFNCNASDDVEVSNLTLIVNGINNYTELGTSSDYLSLSKNLTFSNEGNYNWSCLAFDDTGMSGESSTYLFSIDETPPEINITYPLNGSQIVTFTNPTNISFNASISDDHLSNCWYYNGTANTTVTCDNATLNLDYGDYNLYWYANDTHGNEASEPVSFSINYLQENVSYPNPAIEGETYPINITLNATELNSLNGTLYYNGTAYNTTSSISGSIGTLNTNLFIEAVTTNTVKTFYWNYTLNGENYTSSTYNHTIYFINPINVTTSCSAGLSPSMCFDFKDELNLTALSGDIDYNFKFGISNSSYKEIYGALDSASNFCLCVNSTIYNNYTLGEGEIQYSKSGYADRRFYTFSTQRLSNSTINNTLYLLPSGSATSFLFDFKDTNLAPYINRYTTLLRWYPNLNEYKIVEMAKTDDKGETIMRVQTEDVDYRVGLYERNGSLITLLNPVRFACISAPCSYSSLVVNAERDYTSFFDVEGSIDFNETTNIWTLTWNDPSQNTDSMNLVVTRERGDSSFTICDVSASGFTGILTCDSTGYTGTLVATAYRTASPATPIFQKIINTLSSPFANSVGLFFSFILVALLMLIGVYSPVASVILGIIALLPALYMGVITLAVFIAIAVLGGIIIHFMKRTG